MTDRFVIEAADVWKHYDDAEALRGLTLQVPAGSICGFLGKNGAGKTTAIKLLLGMAQPTKGEVRVFGERPSGEESGAAIRRRIGFVSEDKDLYEYLTVAEMIAFTRPFYPGWRGDLEQKYLQAFGLPTNRDIKDLSRGMRTKLALLLALCHGAELLILDEPTSALDPAAADEILKILVMHVSAADTTVFFSSHHLAEVEQVADHVAIIDRGKTVVAGPLDDLRHRYQRIQVVFDGEAPPMFLRSPGVQRVDSRGRMVTILSASGSTALLDEVRGYGPAAIDVLPVTLKEIFLDTVRTED
jgi:ABC-2 type transport system ATP-binding protein